MKTQSGFEFEIDKAKVTDDWELVELLVEADSGNTAAMIRAMKAIMGEEAYNALKEHVRDKEGHVSSVRMQAEFLEILNQAGEAVKN